MILPAGSDFACGKGRGEKDNEDEEGDKKQLAGRLPLPALKDSVF